METSYSFRGDLREVRLSDSTLQKFLYIDDALLKKMSVELFFKIVSNLESKGFRRDEKGYIVDGIVAIGTGGFVIAKYIYEAFKLFYEKQTREGFFKNLAPLSKLPAYLPVVLEGYSLDNTKNKSIEVKQWFSGDYINGSFVIVDDVSDGGDTFKKAIEEIKSLKPHALLSASIHVKEKTSFIPDVYIERVPADVWIVYPFEKESLEDLLISYAKEFLEDE